MELKDMERSTEMKVRCIDASGDFPCGRLTLGRIYEVKLELGKGGTDHSYQIVGDLGEVFYPLAKRFEVVDCPQCGEEH
jgi:hypothetical protein